MHVERIIRGFVRKRTIVVRCMIRERSTHQGTSTMIDPNVALQLKQAGLEWQPARHDQFTIPGGELANDTFALNDQTILIQSLKGQTSVTFHGAAEWALDDVLLADVVWLPTETQLREAVQQRIDGEDASLTLRWSANEYRCVLIRQGETQTWTGSTAEQVYAQALLFLLRREQLASGKWVSAA